MFGFGHHKLTEEEEKQAVVTLRERLSGGTQPVEEQLRKGGEVDLRGLDDVTMERWLTAESFSIDKAEKRLRAHAEWRAKEFPEGRIDESEVADELKQDKVFLQGLDKFGRRIIWLKVNRHSRTLRDLKQCMRLLCFSLDKAIALADHAKNPKGMITGIFDLRGLTMDSIDYHALRGVLDMLQEHYPERLGKLWMFESPSIFWALWKAVSPFVDSATKKKIEFVSGPKAVDDITAEIDLEVLPEDLGGSAPLVRIQDFDGKQDGSKTAEEASDAKPERTATSNGAKSAIEEVKENGASHSSSPQKEKKTATLPGLKEATKAYLTLLTI